MGMISKEKVDQYTSTKVYDANGKSRVSKHANNAVAITLLGTTHAEHIEIMKANKLEEKLDKVFTSGNAGQFRMGLGNALCQLVKSGTPVVINGVKIKTLDQQVKMPAATIPPKPVKEDKPAPVKTAGKKEKPTPAKAA